MTPEDIKRDKYYRKTYNISLDEYNKMLADQQECCAICGKHRSEFKRALHVDHDHGFDRVKIQMCRPQRKDGNWYATAVIGFTECHGQALTKGEARKNCRQQLRRESVRGLVCWRDNTALQKFQDDANRMDAAAQYIRKFNSRVGIC